MRARLYHFTVCGILAALLLAACDRPFVDPPRPEIEVLTDLSTIFTGSTATIRVEITSPQQIEQAAINEVPLVLTGSVWEAQVPLTQGLNTLRITASDDFDHSVVDTAFAVQYAAITSLAASELPQPRGGHSTTLLPDGSLLVIGGAAFAGGPAEDSAFMLNEATAFEPLTAKLNVARTGHTATLLPDGRVLILGGSTVDEVRMVTQLIETVEIYDPVARTFQELIFEGQPIRRTLHTASVQETADGIILQLYGGRGDIDYNEPRLGTRGDVRTFRFTGTSLVALNTLATASQLDGISGHTLTPLNPITLGEAARYLVTGTFFGSGFLDAVSFVLDYTNPVRITLTDVSPLLTPRTRHAAALLDPGLVLVAGGIRTDENEVLNAPELYVDAADRFFRFPNQVALVKRYGHTATLTPDARILLLGGFLANGNALSRGEFFVPTFSN